MDVRYILFPLAQQASQPPASVSRLAVTNAPRSSSFLSRPIIDFTHSFGPVDHYQKKKSKNQHQQTQTRQSQKPNGIAPLTFFARFKSVTTRALTGVDTQYISAPFEYLIRLVVCFIFLFIQQFYF